MPTNIKDPHASFVDHIIARRDERSLYLQNTGCSGNNLWCTIAIDDHGQIVVFGDFGPMVFGISRGPLEDRIAWMGWHSDVDSYVIEKANIGMSNFRRAMTVATAEDFEADVRQAFAERREDLDVRHKDYNTLLEVLTWAEFAECINLDELERTVEPSRLALDNYLADWPFKDDWERIRGFGERPIPEIGLAHAALRRAHLLLEGAG